MPGISQPSSPVYEAHLRAVVGWLKESALLQKCARCTQTKGQRDYADRDADRQVGTQTDGRTGQPTNCEAPTISTPAAPSSPIQKAQIMLCIFHLPTQCVRVRVRVRV